MLDRYTIGVGPGTTAATADHAISQLWNPSTSTTLYVKEIHVVKITATGLNVLQLRKTTVRGTAGSTITPTIVHDHANDVAPGSGALVDLAAFSTQPTLAALGLHSWALPAAIGSGVMWVFEDPIEIEPGTGLAVTQVNAVASDVGSRHTWSWME